MSNRGKSTEGSSSQVWTALSVSGWDMARGVTHMPTLSARRRPKGADGGLKSGCRQVRAARGTSCFDYDSNGHILCNHSQRRREKRKLPRRDRGQTSAGAGVSWQGTRKRRRKKRTAEHRLGHTWQGMGLQRFSHLPEGGS